MLILKKYGSRTGDSNAYGLSRIFEDEILGNASTSGSGDKGDAGTSSRGLIRYGDRGKVVPSCSPN